VDKVHLVLQELLLKRSKDMVSVPGRAAPPATPEGFEPVNPKPSALKEPVPTEGVRKPTLKKHKTARTTAVIADQSVYAESFLEDKVVTRFSAMRDVVKIVSQAIKIHYRAADGKWRFHITDFVVTLKDGRKLAVLVKKFSKKEEMEELEHLIAQTGYVVVRGRRVDVFDVVDKVRTFNERFGTLEAFDNAGFVRWALKKADRRDLEALRSYLGQLEGTIYFFELLKGAARKSMRRESVWLLIQQGVLRPVRARRIGDYSLFKIHNPEGKNE
jgi:hypothetical protein